MRKSRLLALACLPIVGMVLSGTQVWLTGRLRGAGAGSDAVSTTGFAAAPTLSILCLAALAVIATLALSARWLARVLGVVLSLLGLACAVAPIGVLMSPTAALASAVAKATGISGTTSVGAALDGSIASTPWLWLAFALGLAVCAAGVVAVGSSSGWNTDHRHAASSAQNAPAAMPSSAAGVWDSLDSGNDPTGDDPH